MMPIALDNGIGIEEFESRTFKEVEMMVTSNMRVHERNVKASIMQDYQMIDLIAASVGRIMSKDVVYPEIYDIYPTLFGSELADSIKQDRIRQEQERVSAEWKMFAANRNASLKRSETEVE